MSRKLSVPEILPYIITAILSCLILLTFVPVAYADTGEDALQITNQPDKLVIELGKNWAGAEFELRLDAGIYPVPVTADNKGTLMMELGGSKTYTLRLLETNADDAPAAERVTKPKPAAVSSDPDDKQSEDEAKEDTSAGRGAPPLPILLFFIALLAGAAVFVYMTMKKRRGNTNSRNSNDDDGI